MYQTSDIRKGLKVEMDGSPWVVVEFMFVKPGKGTAFTRTKFRNLLTGNVVERNIRTGDTLAPTDVEELEMAFLYSDDESFHFMNGEDYSQVAVPRAVVGDAWQWLKEEFIGRVMFYKGLPVSVEPPTFVELEVVQTDPGVRGNTATGTTKPATLSTGAVVQVPLFIDAGTWLKIDTRTGEYVERVKR